MAKQFNLETQLTAKIDDLTSKLNRANSQIGRFKNQQKKNNADMKDAFKGTSSAIQDVGNSIANGGISSIPALFRASKTAIASATTGMKGFKKVLISSGIGAVVVAIGSLVAAFTASEQGAARFQKIWMPITVLFDNIIDVLADVGESLIDAFNNPKEAVKALWKTIKDNLVTRFEALGKIFTSLKDIGVGTFNLIGASIKNMWSDQSEAITKAKGEVTSAAKDMGKALLQATTGLTDEQLQKTNDWLKQNNKEMKQSSALAEKIYQTDLKEREQLKNRAKLEAKIADLKLKSREAELDSPDKSIDLLKQAQELEDKLLQTDLEIAKARRDIQIEKNTYARSNKENLDAEAEAIAKVFDIEKQRADQQAATQRRLNSLSRQSLAINNSIRKADEALNKGLKKLNQAGEHEIDLKAKLSLEDKVSDRLDDYEINIKANIEADQESLRQTQDKLWAVQDGIQRGFDTMASSLMGSLGEAENGIERFGSIMADTALQLIGMLLSQSIAQAITNATVSAAGTGIGAIIAQPAFIATAVGGVLSAFASIPKFETGGIIGGSSFTGDNILARVNSGEMILNQTQQANLFGMLNGKSNIGGLVEFKIDGTTLTGVLKNYSKRTKNTR